MTTTLKINGRDFSFWENLEISRSIDTFSTFSFTSEFDPRVNILRETFQPFSFAPVDVYVDNNPLIKGVSFVRPELTEKSNTVTCGGYALPGVLNDCESPADVDGREFDDVTLQIIAEKLAEPFGIAVVFEDDPGPVFEQVAIESGNKIFSFLSGLAKQRNLLIRDDELGRMVFFKPIETGDLAATIRQGEPPFLGASPLFNEQQFFSSVTGLSPNQIKRFSEDFTINNDFLPEVFRPHVFKIDDTIDTDIQTVVLAKIGRMFAESICYNITLEGWLDGTGRIWAPNKIIKFYAPGVMVYNTVEMIVKNVRLKKSVSEKTTVLTVSMPYKVPEALPWLEF